MTVSKILNLSGPQMGIRATSQVFVRLSTGNIFMYTCHHTLSNTNHQHPQIQWPLPFSSQHSLLEVLPTLLTCWNWTQSSRSKSNPQPPGSQPALQPWHIPTLASTQSHAHLQPSCDTEVTPSFGDLPFHFTSTRSQASEGAWPVSYAFPLSLTTRRCLQESFNKPQLID